MSRRDARVVYLGLAAALALCLVVAAPAMSAQLACSPERPTAHVGETVPLRAWTDVPGEPAFAWQVEAGRLEGSGAAVRWVLEGVRQSPVPYAAEVRVQAPEGGELVCRLELLVRPPRPMAAPAPPPTAGAPTPGMPPEPGMRGAREAGRLLLTPEREEPDGYGLYSYLLLGAPPEAHSRERYREAVAAYLRMIPDLAEIERYLPRQRLNVVHLPVTSPLPAGEAVQAEAVLERYDYARARAWLFALPGEQRGGPYLVSSLEPLGAAPPPAGPFLVQDLSRVPPHLASLWVREFLVQAAQQRFWEPGSARALTLHMRTAIGQVAVALPEVRAALERLGLPDIPTALAAWITWGGE